MKTVRVSASRDYDVVIDCGILERSGEYIKEFCKNSFAAIITDDKVDSLYSATLERSLETEGIRTVKYVFPNGERSKNAENYIKILEFLASNHITRSDLVIALGGGVVGDITGFAAGSYLRGVDFVQIPTTLLAMVDSSVGGKTAIDLEAGKNLAGMFYQPRLVLCDTDLLDSLDEKVFSDGCAEVIKYAALGSKEMFMHISDTKTGFDREKVIAECVQMKARIVAEDEFDNSTRQLLNFGHTVGHAAELCSGYEVTHGSAVAIGMATVSAACARAGICDKATADSLKKICRAFSLPTELCFPMEEICSAILSDKKIKGSKITAVLCKGVGECFLKSFTLDEFRSFIAL